MKRLILLRHGKAEQSGLTSDIDRPLAERGFKDAKLCGRIIRNLDCLPDLIISSSARRAVETTKTLCKVTKIGNENIVENKEIYGSNPETLLKIIRELDNSAESVMIVGHNPSFEETASLLLRSHSAVTMPTAGMICFESENNACWKNFSSSCRLVWFICPKLMSCI